jgi:hypothetical protein
MQNNYVKKWETILRSTHKNYKKKLKAVYNSIVYIFLNITL